jgi:hypothetical protein
VRVTHFLMFSVCGGLMLGLGSRDEVPLWAAVPMFCCGWRMMQIGTEMFLDKNNPPAREEGELCTET